MRCGAPRARRRRSRRRASPASGIANFAQAQAAMVQVGVYTVITMSGGDQLFIYNVQPFQLTADNFLFI